MSDQITGYSVAGVIEADPNNEFVWVKFVDCSAAVAAATVPTGVWEEDSFDAGVKAAHEAVAALQEMNAPMIGRVITKRHALAAIDGVEKP